MKTRMKKDLLQGLLTYPAPVYSGTSSKQRQKNNQKFFQFITAPVKVNRLSRRKTMTPPPQIIRPNKRAAIWQDLRKDKNI